MMTWEAIRTLAAVASACVALITVVFAFRAIRISRGAEILESIERGDQKTLEAVKAYAADMLQMRRDLTVVERQLIELSGKVNAAPTHEDLNGIARSLNILGREVSGLAERGEITLSTVRSIQKYLLEKKP